MKDRPWDASLIDRILSGEASEKDIAAAREQSAGDRDSEFMEALSEALLRESGDWDVEAAWASIQDRIEDAPKDSEPSVVPLRPRHDRLAWLRHPPAARAAAAVVLVAGGALLWMAGLGPGSNEHFATASAERDSVFLSDGSLVVLGAGSTLQVSPDFGTEERSVSLDGQAYFVVSASPSRPFLVRSHDAVTRVIGTEFMIEAYPETGHVRVTVAEGLVSVKPSRGIDSVLVNPGFQVRVTGEAVGLVSPADVPARLSWTSGPLVLTDAALGEALPAISRWLGVTFHELDPVLAQRRVSVRLRKGDQNAVDGLALAIGARAERTGSTVRLVPSAP